MPFIPHTPANVSAMLAAIGARSIAELFDEIPAELKCGELDRIPPALNEQQITRLMQERAESDGRQLSFLGAGAYEHHIPAAIWQIVTRGEFYTAYTPYQAEASQGTLQLLYEFQSMMASLTGLEVSNASLYDGASALGEAVLMAIRAHAGRARRVAVPATVHPLYRKALRAIVASQGVEIVELPYCTESGTTVPDALGSRLAGCAALVVPLPNFFGCLEPVDTLTDAAHAQGAAVIAVCNPLALALIKPPGEWGTHGADICCGEAQPLGIPLSGGGPYLGFLTCRSALLRQMPGRIAGRTVDIEGRVGYTLTLQAREQHIRRSKATSNICTNQGLLVVAATIYLSLLGPDGLARVAAASHANACAMRDRLAHIPGVAPAFSAPIFHECALKLPSETGPVLARLRREGILGGYDLGRDYPELAATTLACATEVKTDDDIERFAQALERALR